MTVFIKRDIILVGYLHIYYSNTCYNNGTPLGPEKVFLKVFAISILISIQKHITGIQHLYFICKFSLKPEFVILPYIYSAHILAYFHLPAFLLHATIHCPTLYIWKYDTAGF